MKTTKKVAMSIALGMSLMITGCGSSAAENEVVDKVVAANQEIYDKDQLEIKELRKQVKDLNDLAYMRGEELKWLQKDYDDLLEKYNALLPVEDKKEVQQKVSYEVDAIGGSTYQMECTWYYEGPSGVNAMGNTARPFTCAAGPSFPLGMQIYVEVPAAPEYSGFYTVEDRGGAVHDGVLDLYSLDGNIPSVGRTTCTVWY